MYWYLLSTILLSLCGLIAFVYFARQGQFDDIEDIKYQMFREEEENR
ncbi:MAG: cbb3-type cytochrome oxidase assembly protein [Chlamydiales bacterium]|nr:cbb3-type cytochrome oxidase assembly protein [Chlamydiales bacterium]